MRKITFLLSLLVSVWATAQVTVPQVSTATEKHYYKFISADNDKVRITTNGYGFQGTLQEASTLFTFEDAGEADVYYIKSATYDAYVSAADVAKRGNLKWTENKGDTEKWKAKRNGNYITFISYATRNEATDATQLGWNPIGGNTGNIGLWESSFQSNRMTYWRLVEKNPPVAPEFTPVALNDITDGWYQMKVVSGYTNSSEDKTAGKYVTNTPAHYGNHDWIFSVRAQNVVSSTFVYVEKNKETGKYAIKTCKGKYADATGFISDNPVYPLEFTAEDGDNTHIYVKGQNGNSTTYDKQYMGWYDEGTNTVFIGVSTGHKEGKTFQFSKVDNYIANHYDVYGIEYKDLTPVNNTVVGVTYHADDYNGVRLAYPGGAYFIRKNRGQDVLASNFEISTDRSANFLYLKADMENKKIIVGQDLTLTVAEALKFAEDPNQVGFPATGMEELNAALKAKLDVAVETPNMANLDALKTEFTTWKTEVARLGNIVMPKDGKAYYLRNVQPIWDNNYLLANDENGDLITKPYSDENKDLNAAFVCHKLDDGRYMFTNAAKGNYMVWKGASNGYNNNKGYSETYLANKCAFNVTGQATATRPGLFRLVAPQRGADREDRSSLTLNADGTWNAYSDDAAWVIDDNNANAFKWSNAFYFEEATDYEMNNVTLKTPDADDGYNYASLYLPYATTIPADVEAFSATLSADQQSLNLTAIEGTTLPKNTAVVLRSQNETAATFVPAIEAGTAVTDNALKGTVDANTATPAGTFVLSGAFGAIGFYKYTASTLPAGKAYLESADSAVQGLLFGDGNVTGIEAVETGNDDKAAYYDLSGRRVEHPATGIYVRGGKKVFVK